jgi:hypothetical protein
LVEKGDIFESVEAFANLLRIEGQTSYHPAR